MLALKNHVTTAFQSAAEQHMPTTLVDMIAGYAITDYTGALESYDVDRHREVRSTDRNKRINETIRLALTNTGCDPHIKSKIFAATIGSTHRRSELFKVIEQIQASGVQLNLDNTDLSACNLNCFDLTGMSAKGCSLYGTRMGETRLNGADFSGATFFGVNISGAQLRDVNFTNTRWTRSIIADTYLHRADMSGATMSLLIFRDVDVFQVKTDDQVLKATISVLEKKRGYLFNDKLTGIHSSVHGFSPRKTEQIAPVIKAIRDGCDDSHPDLAFH